MSFSQLITRFIGVVLFLSFIQWICPMSGSSFLAGMLGILMMGAAGYSFWLRIQWDKKMIRMAKERIEQQEEAKKLQQHKSRLRKSSKR